MARPVGRPSKLDAVKMANLCSLIGGDAYIEDACNAVGIHPSTFHRWIAKGEEQEAGEYRDFRDAIQKQIALSNISAVQLVRTHAKDNWQAAAWLLERRNPKVWGRRIIKMEMSGPDDRPIELKGEMPPVQFIIAAAERETDGG